VSGAVEERTSEELDHATLVLGRSSLDPAGVPGRLTTTHEVSAPANWRSNDEAREVWPDGWQEPKPSIRIVPQPS
jgi:hypothetical protein